MKQIMMLTMLSALALPFTACAEDTYSKVDDKTLSVTKTVNETIDIAAVKSNRQSLQTSCDAQLAEYDSLIAEAKEKGVE